MTQKLQLSPARTDRPEEVYGKLRTLIIRGRLAPGVRVVENDIAERFSVSRTPAREAIRRLHADGLLVPAPTLRRTELVVAPLTRDDVMDLYRLMGALEASAARRVADLEPDARRTLARDLKELERDFERDASARTLDYDVLFERHNAFHHRLVEATALPRHRKMIATIRPQVDRYEWVYAPLVGPDLSETFKEHAEIIRTVREETAKRIERAVAANWDAGAERLAAVIANVGSRGDW